jgi:hypothetical protein
MLYFISVEQALLIAKSETVFRNAVRPVPLASSCGRLGFFYKPLQLGSNTGGDIGAVIAQVHGGHVLTGLIHVLSILKGKYTVHLVFADCRM